MKKIFISIVMLLVLTNTEVSAQTANDTTLALAIRSNVQGFSNKYWYTFDKKKFELNQDSLTLYNLTQKNPNPRTLYPPTNKWVETGETGAYGMPKLRETNEEFEKYLWFPLNKVKEGENYACGHYTFASAVAEKGADKYFVNKNILVLKHHYTYNGHYDWPAYIVLHRTIKPSSVMLIQKGGDCWAYPLLTKYKKPLLAMALIPDSLKAFVDSSRFSFVEKLVNDVRLVKPLQVVQATTQDSTKFSLIVSKQDTILFQDFAKEDGDKISIYFDGEIVQESVSIEHRPYAVPTKSKSSLIEIVIESEGSEPPCTLEVLINNKQYLFSKKQGEKITILRK